MENSIALQDWAGASGHCDRLNGLCDVVHGVFAGGHSRDPALKLYQRGTDVAVVSERELAFFEVPKGFSAFIEERGVLWGAGTPWGGAGGMRIFHEDDVVAGRTSPWSFVPREGSCGLEPKVRLVRKSASAIRWVPAANSEAFLACSATFGERSGPSFCGLFHVSGKAVFEVPVSSELGSAWEPLGLAGDCRRALLAVYRRDSGAGAEDSHGAWSLRNYLLWTADEGLSVVGLKDARVRSLLREFRQELYLPEP